MQPTHSSFSGSQREVHRAIAPYRLFLAADAKLFGIIGRKALGVPIDDDVVGLKALALRGGGKAADQEELNEMLASPIHYVTYFDRHYLSRGLALYRSLVRHSPPFVLWVLCLDDETHRTLERLRLEHVELIPIAELERAQPALVQAKPGRQPYEYYWTCGPTLLLHLFQRHSGIDALAYLDADLYFFGDPRPLHRELGDRSILLCEHRFSPAMHAEHGRKGIYNVGLILFRRTPASLVCLQWWSERCLEWCFNRVEPG